MYKLYHKRNEMANIYNFRETLEKLRISKNVLKDLIKEKKINYRLIGKRKFFTEEDISQFLEDSKR